MAEERYISVGEQIIEILKDELVLGLTFVKIKEKLREKYDREISKRGGYVYMKRLMDKGFVKAESVGQKIKAYKLIPENLRKDITKDFEYLKSLFEREAIEIIGSKLTESDFKRLDVI